MLTSRERLLKTLRHEEPDRVPYDLGGSHVSTIHVAAYRRLCEHLNIDPEPIVFSDVVQQVVTPCDELLDRFGVDTRGLFPGTSHNQGFEAIEGHGDHYLHHDEWGFTQKLNKDGFWWSQIGFPLDGMITDQDALAAYCWPTPDDPARVAGLRALAQSYRDQEKVVLCKSLCAGLFEMGQRIRGMTNFLCDLLADPRSAETILDRLLDLKKRYWTLVLDELGDLIDIVVENDDYGTQASQLISPDIYHRLFEPRLRELVGFVKQKHAERRADTGEPGYFFFHSCGNVRPYLPSFIEMGIDILNPVHLNCQGMDAVSLKRDFGRDITLWGGGVETQHTLPHDTPEEVHCDVLKNIEQLMPGGGFVFTPVHNIQAEVPPENILAMWEALREGGNYG